MKTGFVFLLGGCIFLGGCLSKKELNKNLPIDLATLKRPSDSTRTESEKPKSDSLVSWDRLQKIRSSIDSIAAQKICTDASQWRSTPLGAKPCGGPAEYVAYPKEFESAVLKLATEYTTLNVRYNRQNMLQSDCKMNTPPLEIRCQGGKPVLIYDKLKP